jgi:hypothetical protein
MKFDLLVSEDKRSYFINCRKEGMVLEAGATYLAPNTSSPLTLVGEEGVKFIVILPLECVDSSEELVASQTSYFIN